MDDASHAVMADGAHQDLAPPEPVSTVGATLRAAREAQGLSLQDVASRTRITPRHVGAVEAGDYAALPGRPYAIGFARSYARAVGLDEAVIAERVRQELATSAPRPEPRVIQQFEVGDPAKTPSRLVVWLALALAVAIVAMGAVVWSGAYWPAGELPALAAPTSSETAPAPPPAAQPRAAPAGPVVFTALDDAIWVKFYTAAGQQLLQKQLAKGESWTLPADAAEPRLWTGRPDALAITIGGQPVPRLSDQQRIVKDVPVSAAALLARAAPPPAGTAPPLAGAAIPPAATTLPRRPVGGGRPRSAPSALPVAPTLAVPPAADPVPAAGPPAGSAPAGAVSPAT